MKLMDSKIAIIGLGYVGLPLAVEFAKKYKVIGFDIADNRIKELEKNNDTTLEIKKEVILSVRDNLNFTSNMANANYVGTGSNIGSDDSFATGFISDGAVPLSSRMDYQFRNYDTVVATDQDFQRVMTHGDLA